MTQSAKALGQIKYDKDLTSLQSPEEDGHSPIILMLWVTGRRHLLLTLKASVQLTSRAILLLGKPLCAKDTQTYAKKRVQLKRSSTVPELFRRTLSTCLGVSSAVVWFKLEVFSWSFSTVHFPVSFPDIIQQNLALLFVQEQVIFPCSVVLALQIARNLVAGHDHVKATHTRTRR